MYFIIKSSNYDDNTNKYNSNSLQDVCFTIVMQQIILMNTVNTYISLFHKVEIN